ncbi:MAG: hypothetical protein JNK60_07035 [Acidobacteria bacterium]|nr:hypothetical protein [Acidobacteriota bacterium]
MTKKIILAGAFAALAAILPSNPALAVEVFKEKTTFSIAEPLDVGGTVLQPGTYKIKVLKRTSDRHTLQVVNPEDNKVFVTVLAIPHPIREQEVIPESRMVFYPATGSQTRALRTWFGNDVQFGHDIAYPKRRAEELVAVTHEPAPYYPDDTKLVDYDTVAIQPLPASPAPVVAPAPAPPVTRVAEARLAELPQTASRAPLFGLLSALVIGAAVSLRALASRLS